MVNSLSPFVASKVLSLFEGLGRYLIALDCGFFVMLIC